MVIGHLKSPCHACKQPPKNGQFKLVNVHSSQILDPWPQWPESHLLHVGPPEGASDSGPSCVFPQCTRIYIIDKNPRNHIRNTLATNHISWTYYLAVIPSNIATTRQHPPHHLQAIAQLWQVWEGVTPHAWRNHTNQWPAVSHWTTSGSYQHNGWQVFFHKST